ncbi:hypothetical protein [Streptomyces sp. NPDC056480]
MARAAVGDGTVQPATAALRPWSPGLPGGVSAAVRPTLVPR